MKSLWCWRCRADMPMLDDEEYRSVFLLYGECMRATKEFREANRIPLEGADIHERFKPLRLRYEELKGMKDCHQNAIMHHRLVLYGPPCSSCGKLCGSCMAPVR